MWFNLKKTTIIATESTEEHGDIKALIAIFSCSSVDSVAIKKTGAQPYLVLVTRLKDY
jgi:hypothetical protein